MKTEPNHPAIPAYHNDGSSLSIHSFDENFGGMYGLTKREHFAAMAMQGLLASVTLSPLPISTKINLAVEAADALIIALNNKE